MKIYLIHSFTFVLKNTLQDFSDGTNIERSTQTKKAKIFSNPIKASSQTYYIILPGESWAKSPSDGWPVSNFTAGILRCRLLLYSVFFWGFEFLMSKSDLAERPPGVSAEWVTADIEHYQTRWYFDINCIYLSLIRNCCNDLGLIVDTCDQHAYYVVLRFCCKYQWLCMIRKKHQWRRRCTICETVKKMPVNSETLTKMFSAWLNKLLCTAFIIL